jgi:hypothetical protein
MKVGQKFSPIHQVMVELPSKMELAQAYLD